MRTRTYAVGLMLAGLAFANPVKALEQDHIPSVDGSPNSGVQEPTTESPMPQSMDEGSANSPTDESQNDNQAGRSDLALVDYCYAGTTIDPTTGEAVDLYTLCSNDFDQA